MFAVWLVLSIETRGWWAVHNRSVRTTNLTGQAFFDIGTKRWVGHEFGRLGAFRGELGLPLRDRRSVAVLANSSCRVSAQLARNCGGVSTDCASDCPNSNALCVQDGNLLAFGKGQVATRKRF
jgi:hypothetical protein